MVWPPARGVGAAAPTSTLWPASSAFTAVCWKGSSLKGYSRAGGPWCGGGGSVDPSWPAGGWACVPTHWTLEPAACMARKCWVKSENTTGQDGRPMRRQGSSLQAAQLRAAAAALAAAAPALAAGRVGPNFRQCHHDRICSVNIMPAHQVAMRPRACSSCHPLLSGWRRLASAQPGRCPTLPVLREAPPPAGRRS